MKVSGPNCGQGSTAIEDTFKILRLRLWPKLFRNCRPILTAGSTTACFPQPYSGLFYLLPYKTQSVKRGLLTVLEPTLLLLQPSV